MCGREWLKPSCCLRTLLCCQDGLDPHCACWWASSPPSAQVCSHAPTPTPSPPLTPILPKPPPHVLHQIRKWEGLGKCSETLTSRIRIYFCLSNSHETLCHVIISACPAVRGRTLWFNINFFSLRLLYCQWELLKLCLTAACSEPDICIPVSVCLISFQGHLGSDPTHVPAHPALAEAWVKVP